MDARPRRGQVSRAIRRPRRHTMDAENLVERYLDTWNETDAEARATEVAGLFAESGSYTDPLATVSGHEQIAGLIGAVQEQVPGHVFRLLDTVDAHHNVMRFSWELVPASGGDSVAIGFDVAVVESDG